MGVDFPVSGENVCVADKRGAGPAGLDFCVAKRLGDCFFIGKVQSLRQKSKIFATSLYTREALVHSALEGGKKDKTTAPAGSIPHRLRVLLF